MSDNYKKIFQELERNSEFISDSDINKFVNTIIDAKHIFLAGAGRSGVVIQAFGNRLMHLGKSVSIVGEISSPHTQRGDLLIICSGSGETTSLKELSKKAVENDVSVALVTTNEFSSIGRLSDTVLELKGATKISQEGSIQPMGTAFEQLSFITFDLLVLKLMEKLGETPETMIARHANLE